MPGDAGGDQRTDARRLDGDDDLSREEVERIPAAPGMSFRTGAADWWEPGRHFTVPGWLHTSRDPRVGTENFADRDVVALFGATGRDLLGWADHPEEQETLYRPGVCCTVAKAGAVGELWVTVLVVHRDDGGRPRLVDVDVEARRAAATLERALPAPDVALGRPGRYRGPFGDPDGPCAHRP